MSQNHNIPPLPQNMVWGFLDASVAPIITVESGDTVQLTSWAAVDKKFLPSDPSLIDPRHRKVVEELTRDGGSHLLVGPISVRGAEPGDVLQVDIIEAKLVDEWGHSSVWPLWGTLPQEFDEPEIFHIEIDRELVVGRLPWGKELPLQPFFGVMAVAPPKNWGRCSTTQPRKFGGNLDNKELGPGSTLYLPVFNEGALFYAGDGHAVQGNGEVCVTAVETGMSGCFRLTVRKDLDLTFPFAESATHLISMGLSDDLDEAARQAVRNMIEHVCRLTTLSRRQAYLLCSLVGDLSITQTVNGEKGCHMMLSKSHL